jgi:diphosphomevalonate decarboxylase
MLNTMMEQKIFQTPSSAAAEAHPNIALIKYWGDRDSSLRLPMNSSISMNLAGLTTRTVVTFEPALDQDQLLLNGEETSGPALERVTLFLNLVRGQAAITTFARVISSNNFPTGAGIASSAAAFAALCLAASKAAGLTLSEIELSRLARRGSGSASRSIPSGFVEWQAGTGDLDSYAFSIAPPDHWPLADCIAVVSTGHKRTGSTQGHASASTSPFQSARVAQAPIRLELCRQAIQQQDFEKLASVVEADSTLMHAVMMTANPPLFYWEPASLRLMKLIPEWRQQGLMACYTLDAGPNVHVICPVEQTDAVVQRLSQVEGVQQVLKANVGPAAHLVY